MLPQLLAAPKTSLSSKGALMVGLGLANPSQMTTERKQSLMAQPRTQRHNSVRIIAGEYRSRKLDFPSLPGLRPTADRIRETLFNWLQDSIQGERCLDLFAGSGALGFEALSRGARLVDFVEQNTSAADAIGTNLQRLGIDAGTVHRADGFSWLARAASQSRQYGLVFLDPPFADNLLERAIAELTNAQVMKENCLVYVEQERGSDAVSYPGNWEQLKHKQTGSISYALYRVARGDV